VSSSSRNKAAIKFKIPVTRPLVQRSAPVEQTPFSFSRLAPNTRQSLQDGLEEKLETTVTADALSEIRALIIKLEFFSRKLRDKIGPDFRFENDNDFRSNVPHKAVARTL